MASEVKLEEGLQLGLAVAWGTCPWNPGAKLRGSRAAQSVCPQPRPRSWHKPAHSESALTLSHTGLAMSCPQLPAAPGEDIASLRCMIQL